MDKIRRRFQKMQLGGMTKNTVWKHESEWMWQFWLIFGEFLEINGQFSQNRKTSVKINNKTHLYVKSHGNSKKCSPEA